jgi:chorismate mutase
MTERDNAATERDEIVARVARFRATQEKFKREREEYFVATLQNARHSENAHRMAERPAFWS